MVFDSDWDKNLTKVHVKKEHWTRVRFSLEKVSNKVLNSGTAGNIKIKKKGINKREAIRESFSEKKNPIQSLLAGGPRSLHNL